MAKTILEIRENLQTLESDIPVYIKTGVPKNVKSDKVRSLEVRTNEAIQDILELVEELLATDSDILSGEANPNEIPPVGDYQIGSLYAQRAVRQTELIALFIYTGIDGLGWWQFQDLKVPQYFFGTISNPNETTPEENFRIGDYYIKSSDGTPDGNIQSVWMFTDLASGDKFVSINFTGNILTAGPGTRIENGEITLDLESTTLPSLSTTKTWTIKSNDGTVQGTSTSANVIVDKGAKVDLTATWKFATPTAGQKAPTNTSGAWGTDLPAPNTNSDPLNQSDLTAPKKTFTQTATKPKSGLIVVSNQVQFASGNDSASTSISVDFQGRGGFLYSTKTAIDDTDIEAVYNSSFNFWSSKNQTLNNVNPAQNEYLYIVYDGDLPALAGVETSVIPNAITAFEPVTTVQITNKAGITVDVKVYKSNQPGAFTNENLKLS